PGRRCTRARWPLRRPSRERSASVRTGWRGCSWAYPEGTPTGIRPPSRMARSARAPSALRATPPQVGRNPEEAARLSTKEYGTNQFLRHKPKGEILKRRRDSVPSTQYQVPLVRPRAESGERVAAAAGVGLVRVLDGEPGAHQPVAVVEDGALDHFGAGRVDDDLDVTEALDDVVLLDLGVEVHLVLETAAATRPHRHPEGETGLVLGSDQLRNLGLGGLGEGHCAIRLDVEDAGH